MKLSQMTTDQAADALIRISEPASNIMHDADTIAVLEKLVKGDEQPLSFIADNLVPVITVLLKTHRSDLYEILAAFSEKNTADIAGQKITDTIKDIKECWDGELMDFFASLKP